MFFNQGKPHRFPVKPYECPTDNPLATEHAFLATFLAENVTEAWRCYSDLDFSATSSGRKLVETDSSSGARFVSALITQLFHYDEMGRKARSLAASEMDRINWHHSCPEWGAIWPPRSALSQAIKRLMRRKLPLTVTDVTAMARWIGADEAPNDYNYPLKAFTKSVESLSGEDRANPALREALNPVIRKLRDSQSKEMPKLAHALSTIMGGLVEKDEVEEVAPIQPLGPDPAIPADAGSARVLVQLKNYLGTMPSAGQTATEEIGFGPFPLAG